MEEENMSALTCDICGGNLTMNESGDFAVCESCGMKHTKERVKVKVQEIKGVVEITKGEAEKERLLKNAETFMKIGEIDKAKLLYEKIINDYPDDYRGWWGKVMIYSGNFKKNDMSIEDFIKIDKIFDTCIAIAPNTIVVELKSQYKKYKDEYKLIISEKKAELKYLIAEKEELSKRVQSESEKLRKLGSEKYEIDSYGKEAKEYSPKFSEGLNSLLGWAMLAIVIGFFWQKWLIAIGVILLVVFFACVISPKIHNNNLQKQRETIKYEYDKISAHLSKLEQRKNSLDNNIDELKKKYNL